MNKPREGSLALHWRILVGLAIGAIAGLICKQILGDNPSLKWFSENIANTIGQVFLRLIFMVIIPLVFCALTLGVAEIGDVRKLGRLGLITLLMTVLFSGASVLIGLGLANTLRPGASLSEESREKLRKEFIKDADDKINKAKNSKTVLSTILDV
ncbi:MAG: cation:dicarboxylase symporter family transporter, partial [Planctomycetes bacterium]|nr:cation:dicarboxylase symporter family transporter [Planctomycetota bacterium]